VESRCILWARVILQKGDWDGGSEMKNSQSKDCCKFQHFPYGYKNVDPLVLKIKHYSRLEDSARSRIPTAGKVRTLLAFHNLLAINFSIPDIR
jgi:hypothetical protein